LLRSGRSRPVANLTGCTSISVNACARSRSMPRCDIFGLCVMRPIGPIENAICSRKFVRWSIWHNRRGFIAAHAIWFGGWIVFNSTRFAFDPFPYGLLNVIVALEAVFLTSVVLLTQNNQMRLTDRRAGLDLQVNVLAEKELTAMLRMLPRCVRRGRRGGDP